MDITKLVEENEKLKTEIIELKEQLKKYTYGNTHKRYYEKNKEKILKKSRQRFICECGAEVSYSNKKCHKSSSKHIIYVKSKESQNALQNSTLHITES